TAFWCSFILSAHALSAEIPVTTTNLDQYKYLFAVSTNATSNGVAFRITITGKTADILADSSVNLSIVTQTNDGRGTNHQIAPLKPAIPISLAKGRRVWQADFTMSYELLKKPGLCFVFTEWSHENIHDRLVPAESADFYEIKLQDFLKR